MITMWRRRRPLRRDRADRWADAFRGAAVAVLLVGTVASVVAAQAWQATVNRQRDERPVRAGEHVHVRGAGLQLRYAPLPGNAILTERTIGASVVLGAGMAVAILLAALLWLLAQVGALYREVDRLARTDSLTGVANRRAWDQELPRELARASRSGRPLCLALLDLDHFKDYNDQHGHQAGDRLLKAAAPPSPRAPARSGWPPGTAARAPTS